MRKWMVKLLLLAFICVSIHVFDEAESYALSCVQIPNIEEAYEQYDGVIIGRVDKIKSKQQMNHLELVVEKSFKEIETRKLSITEDAMWGNLNGPSEVEQEYLFFLNNNHGQWTNPLCSPSKVLSEAFAELEFLADKQIWPSLEGTPHEDQSDANMPPDQLTTDSEETNGEMTDSNDESEVEPLVAQDQNSSVSNGWFLRAMLLIVLLGAGSLVGWVYYRKR